MMAPLIEAITAFHPYVVSTQCSGLLDWAGKIEPELMTETIWSSGQVFAAERANGHWLR